MAKQPESPDAPQETTLEPERSTPRSGCMPRARRRRLGLDDVTWAMMLMAIREPSREAEKRESA
jgi:hypothetical protein